MFNIEVDREVDGRWIAEVTDLPGVMTYGQTRQEAVNAVMALALRVIGWRPSSQRGSHRTLCRDGDADYTFSFHDGETIGPVMLARIAKHTGLTPDDL